MYVNIFTYIYIYIHMNTCIYIYNYIHICTHHTGSTYIPFKCASSGVSTRWFLPVAAPSPRDLAWRICIKPSGKFQIAMEGHHF